MARDIGFLQSADRDIGFLQSDAGGVAQELTPDSIPSGSALGGPTLTRDGDAQTVTLGGIGPGSSLGAIELIGPQVLTPAGIASTASLGAPTLIGSPSTISPAGIASGSSLGAPRLANTLTIRPDSTASTAALGEPTLTGPNRVMFPDSIVSGSKLGPITLQGGADGMQSFVAGANRTRWMRRGTLLIRSRVRGRWTGQVEYHSTPNGYPHHVDTALEWIRPSVGMTALFTEFGRTLFRGCVAEVGWERLSGTDVLTYTVELQDKTARCDARKTKRPYLATEDAAAVIRDILVNSLNGEGLALDPDFPATLGELGTPMQAFISVTQAFDFITEVTGLPWFIDLTQILYFVDPTVAEEAPFSLTETSGNWKEESIEVRETLTGYFNSETIVSNRRILSGDGSGGAESSRTETYTMLDAGGGVGYQAEARNRPSFPLPDGYLLLQFPIQSISSITINGAPFPVYDIADPAWESFINGSGFLVQAFYFQKSTSFVVPVLAIAPGSVVAITYVPVTSTAAEESGNPLTVSASTTPLPGELGGTCGSGIFEHVEQVNDVNTEDEAQALAEKRLEKFSIVPKILTFTTYSAGLQVGQKINVNIPRHLITDVDFFITGISGRSLDGTDLGELTSFEFRVTADTIGDRGDSLKFWERFYARTRHPSPFDNTIPTAIVLGPGSALLEGVSFTNPGRLNVTGQLVRVVARFNDPPEDQDLIVDVLINGASILDSEKIRIPADETGELIFTNFAQPLIQGYVGDKVDVSVSYQVTGSEPVAARNGTIYLLWTA